MPRSSGSGSAPGGLAAIAPAVVGVAEDARQQHRDHLVAQAQAGEPLGDLRARDVLEQPAVLIELRLGAGRQLDARELASRAPQHVAARAARHRQHHADVVDRGTAAGARPSATSELHHAAARTIAIGVSTWTCDSTIVATWRAR